MSRTSVWDTTPVNKIIPALIAAGHASLIPFGLHNITAVAIRNTKIEIIMWIVIVVLFVPSFLELQVI
jgi:hypothetical protein